jgi:hypothetical protein
MENGFLFLGNYDNGIVVGNNYKPNGHITGALAQKCKDVSPRATHYLGPEDAAILYESLPADYIEYYRGLYGYEPRALAPFSELSDADQPLSLLKNILSDPTLIEKIGRLGRQYGWRLAPFIHHELVFHLARRTGLPVADLEEETLARNRIADFNNKEWFRQTCQSLEIPTVPGSRCMRGTLQVLEQAELIYDSRHGSVILRHSMGAGGLGNILATPKIIAQSGHADLGSYLLSRMVPEDMWEQETVLVEPVLEVKDSPATLVRITPDGIRLVSHSRQIVKDFSYVGSVAPSGLEAKILDNLLKLTRRYAEHLRCLGGYGYCGIDWGVLNNGSLMAFESNFRYGGMVHVVEIRKRLRPDLNGVITYSNDALKVSKRLTLEDVLRPLRADKLDWNPHTGEGVVIAIPPKNGSLGYVALADSLKRAEEMNEYLLDLGANSLA